MPRIFVPSHLSNRGIGDHRNRTDLVQNLAKAGTIQVAALADSSVKSAPNFRLFPAINLMFAFPRPASSNWGKLKHWLWFAYFHSLRIIFLLYSLALVVATRSRLLFLYWPTSVEGCWLALLSRRLLSTRAILWLNGHMDLASTHRVRIHYEMLRRADALIIPSEGMWKYFLSRKAAGLATEPRFIAKEDFGYISRSRSRLDLPRHVARNIVGMPQQNKIVLACGRWHPFKGFDHIVRLAAILADKDALLLLVVSGGGPGCEAPDYRAAVLEEAKRFNNISVVEDAAYESIPLYMRCADLLVMASEQDNYNDTFREALVNGLPVVAFEAGLNHSEVGDVVERVPNGDIRALTERVLAKLEILPHPRDKFEFWVKKFSTENVALLLAAKIREAAKVLGVE